VAGYFLDLLPTLLVLLVGWIPIIGFMLAGAFLVPYWLLRDITGGSLGKLVLGLRVVRKDGLPASAGARAIRNVPLIFGPLCMLVPILGYIFAIPIAMIVVFVEAIMLLSQGDRLGDRLAGTTVVKK
jgi:uncharacterized RDD family membrane protein YckC